MNKILAICTSPDKGGLELYFTKLINHYSNYQSIYPVCKKDSHIQRNIKIATFLVNKINMFNILFYAIKLARAVDKNQIKIIHISWTKDILLAVLIKKFSRIKPSIIYYRQMKITRTKNDFYHRFLYRNLDLILVITEKLANEAKKFFPIPEGKIKKLTYGIDKPSMREILPKNNLFKKLNFSHNLFTIGIFSRIEEQKGQHLVIEALHKIKPTTCQLLIVGYFMNENYKKRINNLISSYNLQNHIKFFGFIDEPMSMMPCFDLIVLPTYEETFGLVVAESMMMGVPIIGSNAGGVPEIIKDGNNGLIFETKSSDSLTEKISMLINDKDLRRKLAQNAKVYAEQAYNYEQHFDLLNDYIDKI